jgi:hypothetical protein
MSESFTGLAALAGRRLPVPRRRLLLGA